MGIYAPGPENSEFQGSNRIRIYEFLDRAMIMKIQNLGPDRTKTVKISKLRTNADQHKQPPDDQVVRQSQLSTRSET